MSGVIPDVMLTRRLKPALYVTFSRRLALANAQAKPARYVAPAQAGPEGPALRRHYTRAALSAASTRSGLKGTRRSRTPVAS